MSVMASVQITASREAAFAALTACQKQGAWSDQAIKSAAGKFGLSSRDAALAAHICYGVLQNRLLLDAWIDQFSKTPAKKLDAELLVSLRMGLYQLQFLDRVPARAAVNESVNLVRKYARNPKSAGLANAALRSAQRAGDRLPIPESGDSLRDLSVRYSHPLPLVQLLRKELDPDGLEAFLQANNAGSDMVIQVNSLVTTAEELCAELEEAGLALQAHPWMKDCFLVKSSGNLEQLPAFQAGKFYVQDCAAKLAAMLSGAQPQMRVLDACAAPGGKSFALGILMQGIGEIISCDLHEKKLSRLRSGARRLGLNNISAQCADGRAFHPEWEGYFDVVLADVPCSGLGIIRKKPDIRYKNLQETEGLPRIQGDILDNVSRYVKPGGILIYSTCTVLTRENQNVVQQFLRVHSEFHTEPFSLNGAWSAPDGMMTLWPQIHGTDGFFVAKIRRENV